MSSGKRKLVRTMVFEAFNRFEDDADARQAFVRERCRDNPEFLPIAMEEIEIEERIRQGQFMEKPAVAGLYGVIPEGTLIGDYRIGALIGEGAMGAVYRARQISLDRDVAVKTLRTPLATQAGLRFVSEAKILSRIASAHVIHVYAYGDFNGQPYIAMEYGEGTNLGQMIGERRFPDIKARLAIALQIAEGLEQIHAASIAHRDVKPSNVLVDGKGNVKLIDFGIAWREDSRMTELGQAMGTPAYMPPEQILRLLGGSATDVDQYKRVDIYSFGILLYELFTGELPFQGETRGEVEQQILHTPVLLEPLRDCHVPEGVVELIRLASSKNPAARPRSFTEVVNVLRIYIADGQAKTAARPPRSRSLRTSIVAAAVLAALITVTAVYQLKHDNAVHVAGPAPSLSAPPMSDVTPPETRPVTPAARESLPVSNKASVSPAAGRQGAPNIEEPTQAKDPVRLAPQLPLPEPAIASAGAAHAILPDMVLPVESVEDRDWTRVRDTRDVAALEAFWTMYPHGKHAAEARRLASNIDYERIKNSNSAEVLQSFAQKYPEHPFAQSAISMANQLKARVVASDEIRQTLKSYANAMHRMKLAEVLPVRELDKQLQSKIEDLFHASRSIEMTLAPTATPQFAEPVVADPAGMHETPSHAVVESELEMLVVSGSGDARSQKGPVTVHLKRTAKGWVITSL